MTITVNTELISAPVQLAAGELTEYLSRMVRGEGMLHFTLKVRGEETMDGFSVDADDHGGTIVGDNARSVLLGVYDYLHHLGCRFLSPVKDTEFVPEVDAAALAARYEKKASFRHRGVCIEGADSRENVLDFIAWLPKLGYNSFFLQFKVPYVFLSRWYHHQENPLREAENFTMDDARRLMTEFESAMEERGLLLHKAGHGWTGEALGMETVGSWDAAAQPLLPEKQAFAAEIQGKRGLFHGVPANTNLCLANPDAVAAFAEQVVHYARENPKAGLIHIWLADAYNNVCECEACRKTTIADQYVELLNDIDQRLAEENLPHRLVFLLYQELLWPPIRARLNHPERFVLMFAPISRTFEASYQLTEDESEIPPFVRNHITLPTSLTENLAFLKGWQAAFAGDSFVYDYPLGRAHFGDFGYLHIARIIGQDIKKLRRMGLDGYISCQELRAAMPNMLPNYMMGQLLWDENADIESVIDEYFTAAYGEDRKIVQDYLETLSRLSSCDYLNGKGERVNPPMALRLEAIVQICRELEKAKLTDGFWQRLLAYHNGYVLCLAQAMAALAKGENASALKAYDTLRTYIFEGESQFQSFFDAYRVMEVTGNYTGFKNLKMQ